MLRFHNIFLGLGARMDGENVAFSEILLGHCLRIDLPKSKNCEKVSFSRNFQWKGFKDLMKKIDQGPRGSNYLKLFHS